MVQYALMSFHIAFELAKKGWRENEKEKREGGGIRGRGREGLWRPPKGSRAHCVIAKFGGSWRRVEGGKERKPPKGRRD